MMFPNTESKTVYSIDHLLKPDSISSTERESSAGFSDKIRSDCKVRSNIRGKTRNGFVSAWVNARDV